MPPPNKKDLHHTLERLKIEHQRLDQEIEKLNCISDGASLELHRLKKKKRALKDQINKLKDLALPDIIA